MTRDTCPARLRVVSALGLALQEVPTMRFPIRIASSQFCLLRWFAFTTGASTARRGLCAWDQHCICYCCDAELLHRLSAYCGAHHCSSCCGGALSNMRGACGCAMRGHKNVFSFDDLHMPSFFKITVLPPLVYLQRSVPVPHGRLFALLCAWAGTSVHRCLFLRCYPIPSCCVAFIGVPAPRDRM